MCLGFKRLFLWYTNIQMISGAFISILEENNIMQWARCELGGGYGRSTRAVLQWDVARYLEILLQALYKNMSNAAFFKNLGNLNDANEYPRSEIRT